MKIDRDRIKDKGKVKVKMLAFDEKVDSMDAYLSVYESFARAQNWEVDIWALNLPFLLKGTAREVYDRLPPDERTNYEKLKDALLRQFELTEDGYKKRFRSERPFEKETFVMFVAGLQRYLDGWLRLSKVHKNYQSLLDLV